MTTLAPTAAATTTVDVRAIIVFAGGALLLAVYAFRLLRRDPAPRQSVSGDLADASLARR
jgi:hypothetical protein